jgi:hypothetical protein
VQRYARGRRLAVGDDAVLAAGDAPEERMGLHAGHSGPPDTRFPALWISLWKTSEKGVPYDILVAAGAHAHD